VHVMLEPSREGFWQPEWRTLLHQQGFPSPPRRHHCCHHRPPCRCCHLDYPTTFIPPRVRPPPMAMAEGSLPHLCHRYCCHDHHITVQLPLPSLRDVGKILVSHNPFIIYLSHLPMTTQTQRRHITPTPAALFVTDAFPWLHVHGGGVFHPHPPPRLSPISSRGYMNMAAAYFTHTFHLVRHQYLPAATRTWQWRISPTLAALFVANIFLWLHEHGGGVFHPHPPPRLSPISSCGYMTMAAA